MQNSVATIQCSNPNCQESNPRENKFCHNCGTPLIKRYLRALGDWIQGYQVGQFIDSRYLLIGEKILLDTQPGVTPKVTESVPPLLRPYHKLFPYRLHIPQVYSYFLYTPEPPNLETDSPTVDNPETPKPQNQEIAVCLLEYSGVPLSETGELIDPNLLPELTSVWPEASPLRQLNWLWQIVKLWQPLESQEMVSSLLNPSLIRVNGTIVQILELTKDQHHYYSIKQLETWWSTLVETASPLIADFLQELCNRLHKGKIPHPEYLLNYLEPAIARCGQWYHYQYQLLTRTDPGPTRHHNEDSCYPPPGEAIDIQENALPFALVCDGIGGQDGGEIASELAKDILVKEMPKLLRILSQGHSHQYLQQLERVICLANDHISERNDSEQRQDRQRMGTTLVMALGHGHDLYLANVGDSRIYQITPTSCYQVTVDDDLASREVSLAYLFYREAIEYPNAGALVQALGMSHSESLHPNLSRLIIDEDCVLLLCSDGLSDYDRVEQYWDSEIAPILQGKSDLTTVGQRLMTIANTKNGHDNTTIALMAIQVQFTPDESIAPLSIAAIESSLSTLLQWQPTKKAQEDTPTEDLETEPTIPVEQAPPTNLNSEPIATPASSPSRSMSASTFLWLSVGVIGLLAIAGAIFLTWQWLTPKPSDEILIEPSPSSVRP